MASSCAVAVMNVMEEPDGHVYVDIHVSKDTDEHKSHMLQLLSGYCHTCGRHINVNVWDKESFTDSRSSYLKVCVGGYVTHFNRQ